MIILKCCNLRRDSDFFGILDNPPWGVHDEFMEAKQKVIHRLKIARGHLNKVIDMAEKGEYCIDILIQSKAVRGALEKADALLLRNHLSTCVVDHIKNGRQEQAVEEVLKVFAKNG
jgi:CsoR family transcriptional regulator, copper-sensing transcriptional repressor